MPLVNLSGDSWYCQEEITVECCIFSLSQDGLYSAVREGLINKLYRKQ